MAVDSGPESKTLFGTFRVTLTHEDSGRVVLDRGGVPAQMVQQLSTLLCHIAPIAFAARGAQQVWAGLQSAMAGLSMLQPTRRRAPAARGRR